MKKQKDQNKPEVEKKEEPIQKKPYDKNKPKESITEQLLLKENIIKLKHDEPQIIQESAKEEET